MLAGKDSKVLYIGCRIKILSKRGPHDNTK